MRRWDIAVASDTGQVRSSNEDYYCHFQTTTATLLAVADGMGGCADGALASTIAIHTLSQHFRNALRGSNSVVAWESVLREAFLDANEEIMRTALERQGELGMGTTLTALVITQKGIICAHCGDSRLYRVRGGRFEQLTADHSLVGEMVRKGGLTEEEARAHPQRNVLTNALGTQAGPRVDLASDLLWPEDNFLLCTDGLINALSPAEIDELILAEKGNGAQSLAYQLVSMANARGGPDNITVVVALWPDRGRW